MFNEAGGGGSGALFPLFAPLFGQIPGAPWGAQALPPPPVPYGQITGQRHGPAPNENKTNSAKCCTNAQQDCIIYKIRNNNQRSGAVVSVLGSYPKGPWIDTTLRYLCALSPMCIFGCNIDTLSYSPSRNEVGIDSASKNICHRSHFGSRYKSGCCISAGLFCTFEPIFQPCLGSSAFWRYEAQTQTSHIFD